MRVLVTGAAGYIGGRMVDFLCAQEWVEAVVGTDIKKTQNHAAGCAFYRRDIRDEIQDLIENERIDTVVHAAYVVSPIHNKSLMEDVNKGGTRRILEASAEAGVKQILYISSTTAYGFWPDNDRPLTEESPLRGNDDFTYAKNKKEIEAIVQEFAAGHPDIKVTTVRPCVVIGPGINNPVADHLKRKFVLLPSNTLPWQFVHEDDLVKVMALLLEKRTAGIFNVTGEGTMTFGEMVATLGNTRILLPWSVLFLLNNLAWFLRLESVTKFPSAAMRMMVNPWVASSEKLIRATGYEFTYNSRTAFGDFAGSVEVETEALPEEH